MLKNMKKIKISEKTILEIKEARERIKKGEFYMEEEAKKLLNCFKTK